MQGLLSQQQPEQQAARPADKINMPTERQAGISNADLQKHIQNIVVAAQHVMYSPQTRARFMNDIESKIHRVPPPVLAANTAVDLIFVLIGQSQMKMNPKAVVPAGIIISGDILGFIEAALKQPMKEVDAHKTIELFTQGILARIGGQ